MTATVQRTTGSAGATNDRVELGRYTTTAGERVIYGQRVLGVRSLFAEEPRRCRGVDGA